MIGLLLEHPHVNYFQFQETRYIFFGMKCVVEGCLNPNLQILVRKQAHYSNLIDYCSATWKFHLLLYFAGVNAEYGHAEFEFEKLIQLKLSRNCLHTIKCKCWTHGTKVGRKAAFLSN